MSYILRWKNPALPGKTDITVPLGSVVSDQTSLRFTGKGAPNYGAIQQENLMRLLESFADATPPVKPTIGQEWFDTASGNLKVCTSVNPVLWKSLGGIQVTTEAQGNTPPTTSQTGVAVGDMWFQRTGPRTGILYVYTGYGRHPENFPAIGGWNQVWPMVETVAGREEYDSVAALVNQLIGDPSLGGSGALGRNLAPLPDLATLDTDLLGKYQSQPDARFVFPTDGDKSELKVDVTSQDWDLLLSAAKFAVSRLDLPPTMVEDISPVPFVSDGRPAPTVLLGLPTDDARYPSLERRSNRRFGIVTLIRCFAETVNVLSTAVVNRYALKGINGVTGTNPNFDSNVNTSAHRQFSGAPAGAPGGSVTMAFNFANPDALTSFLTSGGAIQLALGYTPPPPVAVPPAPPPGSPQEITEIFNTPGAKTWTAPTGVTALSTISGYGTDGTPGDTQSYWLTDYVTTFWKRPQGVTTTTANNHGVRSDPTYMYYYFDPSKTTASADCNDTPGSTGKTNIRTSSFEQNGGTTYFYSWDCPVTTTSSDGGTEEVRSRSTTKTYFSQSAPPAASCGPIEPTPDSTIYYQQQQCLEYPVFTESSSGTADTTITAFGKTFIGARGATYSNVAVTAGQVYNFTIPSGGSLQFTYTKPAASTTTSTGGGGGTSATADTELKNLFDQRGILRLTADRTRVFANVFPPNVVASPLFSGLKDAPTTGRILTSQAVAGASYTISCSQLSPTQLRVTAAFSATGPLNGNVTVKFDVIRDTTTYMVGNTLTPVFGSPMAFANGDRVEGSAFLN